MNILYAYSPYIWPSIIAILFIALLAIYSARNQNVPGAFPFTIACVLAILSMLGSLLEFSAVDLATKIFWRKFQVTWQLPSATAITCFLLAYTWPKRGLTRRNLLLLSIVPVLVILAIITNNVHRLFWEGFILNDVLVPIHGPLVDYFLAYVVILAMINLIILVWLFIHSPENRWPAVLMIIGQSMLRVLFFIDVSGRNNLFLPLTAIGYVFTSLMYIVVLFRFRILGPIPLARVVVLDQIPIGILVLNHKDRVNSLNPAAERMLMITSRNAKGKDIREVLQTFPQIPLSDDIDRRLEFTLGTGKQAQDYHLDNFHLRDWRDLSVGQLLLLTNVTAEHKTQAQILTQQRVLATLQERDLLARELHDDLAQVLAFIHTQGQTIQRLLKRGDVVTADRYLERLVATARDGELDLRKSILGMRLILTEQGLLATLKNYLLQLEEYYNIRTEIIVEDSFNDKNLDEMVQVQTLRILMEALNNVRKHAQAGQVTIIFESMENSVCIAVQDDGRGYDVIETDFDPEKHFGLQMMRERAEAINGEIHFSSQPGQGTEVRVCVPVNQQTEVG